MATIKDFFWKPEKHPGLHKPTYIIENGLLVKSALRLLEKECARQAKPTVGLDLETTGLDPQMRPVRTRLLTVAAGKIVVVFDLFKLAREHVPRIVEWIMDPSRIKVIHNAKFDLKFLCHELGCGDVAPLFDTQLAAQLLDLGDRYGRHDLGYCLDHFLGIKVAKDIRHGWSGDLMPGQLIYASNDAAHLTDLRAEMVRRGRERGLFDAYRLEFEAIQPTVAMELAGFKLDRKRWAEVAARTRVRLTEVEDALLALLPVRAGDPMPLFEGAAHFNFASNEELKERLRGVGVKLPKLTDDDGVEKDTLLSDKMAQIAGKHQIIPLVIEYTQLTKALNSYGKNFLKWINPHDGRLHADFRQIGTVATRYTVKQPPLHGIPKKSDHRECFVAEPGWKLVWADYSQIELRILAELSGDERMLEAFVSGQDLHTQTASELFGVSYDLVEEIQRRRAKDLNFGIPYGVGPFRFAERAGIEVDAAKEMMAAHARKYPKANTYLRNAGSRARATGACGTMSGKVIKFVFDRKDPKQVAAVERHGKNYTIQGSSADITKVALRLYYDRMDRENAKIVNCVHDELVLEVRDGFVKSEAAKLKAAMTEAGERFLKSVPVVVDVEVNDYWRKRRVA